MGLCLIADSWFLQLDNWIGFGMAIFGVGLVIFVHELGHFLVAKACGVKCEKFYLGFDPPIKIGPFSLPPALVKHKWGETEYGIGIIPLGGYVKMLGQDDNPANAAEEAERTKIRKQPEDDSAGTSPGGEEQFDVDPRSYTAKSVPQRMAIISAGVIMNLIFAVVFATVAYSLGVPYVPCEIRATVPGDPAWVAGVRPGDKIIQMGRQGTRSEQLRFNGDLRLRVFAAGSENSVELLVRHPDQQEEWISLRPGDSMKAQTGMPSLGIFPAFDPVLAPKRSPRDTTPATRPGSPAARAEPAFENGDRIVKINGKPVADGIEMAAVLAAHPDDALTFTVERKMKQAAAVGQGDAGNELPAKQIDIKVARNPILRLGLVMKLGPVTAVRDGSVAQEAGLKIGDVIRSIDAASVGDPITLPDRLRLKAGTPVTFAIDRPIGGDATESILLEMTPRVPKTFSPVVRINAPVALRAIGATCEVVHTVQAVEPRSPADGVFEPGDELVEIEFFRPEKATETVQPSGSEDQNDDSLPLPDPIEFAFDGKNNWAAAVERIQYLPPDTKVKITYRRGKKEKTAELTPSPSPDRSNPDRGFVLAMREEVRTARDFREAVSLGFRETRESLFQVVVVLRRITESYKSLGGPGTIMVVATSEATRGWARLLVFLTLISANLAVINFLPIPVLDGGHMVFLTIEGIRGKPVSENVQIRVTIVGLTFILTLMLFVIFLDVTRFLPWIFPR